MTHEERVEREILERRARALAAPRAEGADAVKNEDALVFHVRRATYAIGTEVVLGVRKLDKISPVPRGAGGIAGLAVVDGDIVQVVRLDSVGPVEGTHGSLAVVLGRTRPELALLTDEVVGIQQHRGSHRAGSDSATGDRSTGAIVFLDGVALLRSRSR